MMIRPIVLSLVIILHGSLSSAETFKVIVDPGHGGKDRGAVYYGNVESQINLAVANALRRRLEADSQFSVQMTRTSDRQIDLEQRVHFAEENHGKLFVSIHTNAFNRPNARGAEIYLQNQLPPGEEAMYLAQQENVDFNASEVNHWPLENLTNSQNYTNEVLTILKDMQLSSRIRLSERLAVSLQKSWGRSKNLKPPEVKQAPFFVISNVSMPSTLVELGYLSNPREAALLTSKDFQEEIAFKIYSGIVKFKETIDKDLPSSLN